jgi:hypothetical protein
MKSSYRHPFLKLKEKIEDFYSDSESLKSKLTMFPRVKRFTDLNVEVP